MDESGTLNSDERPAGQDSTPADPHRTGPARSARIAAYVAAAALALGAGFGLTKLVAPPRPAPSRRTFRRRPNR